MLTKDRTFIERSKILIKKALENSRKRHLEVMADQVETIRMMSYEEFLRKLQENNECPCCPLLDHYEDNDFIIHQMHKAIQMEKLDRIHDILENVKDITLRRDFEGSTILQYALSLKNVSIDVIEMLIKADKNLVNVADYNRFTPIHQAVWNLRIDLVCLLLKSGALVNTKTMVNETTLHFAAARGDFSVIQYLVLDGGADTRARNNYGSNPLGKLCAKYFHDMENKLECVKFLLKHTYDEVPGEPGYYSIKDIVEPALLNVFSPRRRSELDCIDEVTSYFLDEFYCEKYNSKHSLIQKLTGPVWKLGLFLHDEIENVEDIMRYGLRNTLTYTKELNQIVYSYLFVNLNFDEDSLSTTCELITEIFRIGLRIYLEKEIFTGLLFELYFQRPKPSLVKFVKHLVHLREPINFNSIYSKLVRRLTITKSIKTLASINPIVLPFCTFVDIDTVDGILPAPNMRSLKEICRSCIRTRIIQNCPETGEFVNAIMSLDDLPMALKLYLRFIESGYGMWAKHFI